MYLDTNFDLLKDVPTGAALLAIDTETTLIPDAGKIRRFYPVPDLALISWAWAPVPLRELDTGKRGWTRSPEDLTRLLLDPDVTLVFHNVAFDCAVLTKACPDIGQLLKAKVKAGKVLDTRVMYRLRAPASGVQPSLAFLSEVILGCAMKKDAVRTSFRPGQAFSVEQLQYAVLDATTTLAVALQLRRKAYGSLDPYTCHHELVVAGTNRTDYQGENPDVAYSRAAAWCAWELEPRGLKVDPAVYKEILADHEEQLAAFETDLMEADLAELVKLEGAQAVAVILEDCPVTRRAWTPHPRGDRLMVRRQTGGWEKVAARVKLNTKKLRVAYARAALDLNLDPPRTEKGEISTKYDFWKQYREDLPAPIQVHLKFSKVRKIMSSFLAPLRDADEIYPSYWIPGAVTGRWACARPNQQQQPKFLRRMYLPVKKGMVFVGADYKSLELFTLANTLASMGLRGNLMQFLERGDVHRLTAAVMYGKDPDDVTDAERQNAKMANFGLGGGMGARTFLRNARAKGLEWTLEDAQFVRDRWLETYPEVRQFLEQFNVNPWSLRPQGTSRDDWLRGLGFDPTQRVSGWDLREALDAGQWFECVLPAGRRIRSRSYSAAANIFFQGPGGDVITHAFNNCCDSGLEVVTVVHDSITLQCPNEQGIIKKTSNMLQHCMSKALYDVCPHVPIPAVDVWHGGTLQ
jgi:hypothetical protein